MKHSTILCRRTGFEVTATTEIFHEDYDPATGTFTLVVGLYFARLSTGGTVSLAIIGNQDGRPVTLQKAYYALTQEDFNAALRGEVVEIDNELSLGSTDSSVIDGQPVKVRTLMAGEKIGKLKVTPVRLGNIVTVEVSYDASPFLDTPKLKLFPLNQRQLEDYMLKGPNCVLEEKSKPATLQYG